MSDVWLSRKTWTCKYCDVTINDDAPSRRQHEGGMRHKANVERSLKDMYRKSAMKRKEEKEHEKEMQAIEKAAQASHQLDLARSAGPSISAAPTSAEPPADASSQRKLPAWKPKDPYAAYTTAASLGFKEDPEIERQAQEAERRSKEGVSGEWQVVEDRQRPQLLEEVLASSSTSAPTSAPQSLYPPSTAIAEALSFRPSERTLRHDEDDAGDDGMEIRVKKRIKMEPGRFREEEERKKVPVWAPVRLIKKEEGDGDTRRQESTDTAKAGVEQKENKTSETTTPTLKTETALEDPAIESRPVPSRDEKPPKEELEPPEPSAPANPSMFRKRKAGAGAGAKKVRSLV